MDEFKNLHEAVKGRLSQVGFKKPTLVQREAIPKLLEGKNSLLIAPTGTGKTEAALLPIFSQFMEEGSKEEGIKIIYIAPLRALNRDMLDRLQKWSDFLDLDIQVRHGDTTQYQRRQQALDPPDMLITTPETLQAILPGSRMKEHLKHVNWTVIDEVHELAESKRGIQLTIGLERLARLAEDFQRIGLSATIGNEEGVAKFLAGNNEMEKEMKKSVEELKDQLSKIHTGRANPTMIEDLKVDYYGSETPINQIANVTAPEGSLLAVQPYDASQIDAIEKAIMEADLGLNPTDDGNVIRIPVPKLSAERREEYVDRIEEMGQETKISLRNIRRETNKKIESKEEEGELTEDDKYMLEDEVDETTDSFVEKVDELLENKAEQIKSL